MIRVVITPVFDSAIPADLVLKAMIAETLAEGPPASYSKPDSIAKWKEDVPAKCQLRLAGELNKQARYGETGRISKLMVTIISDGVDSMTRLKPLCETFSQASLIAHPQQPQDSVFSKYHEFDCRSFGFDFDPAVEADTAALSPGQVVIPQPTLASLSSVSASAIAMASTLVQYFARNGIIVLLPSLAQFMSFSYGNVARLLGTGDYKSAAWVMAERRRIIDEVGDDHVFDFTSFDDPGVAVLASASASALSRQRLQVLDNIDTTVPWRWLVQDGGNSRAWLVAMHGNLHPLCYCLIKAKIIRRPVGSVGDDLAPQT